MLDQQYNERDKVEEDSKPKRTEIKLEFLGTAGMDPMIANISAPRAVMDFNHVSQHLPLLNPDENLLKTGIEYELGKYINDVRVDHDCVVIAVIPKYGNSFIEEPPVYTVLFEYEKDGKFYARAIIRRYI